MRGRSNSIIQDTTSTMYGPSSTMYRFYEMLPQQLFVALNEILRVQSSDKFSAQANSIVSS